MCVETNAPFFFFPRPRPAILSLNLSPGPAAPALRSPPLLTPPTPATPHPTLNSLYNNIKPPSWLSHGSDLHLFKAGVEPKWEDPECEHGGKWTVLVPKGASSKQALDTMWLNLVRVRRGRREGRGDRSRREREVHPHPSPLPGSERKKLTPPFFFFFLFFFLMSSSPAPGLHWRAVRRWRRDLRGGRQRAGQAGQGVPVDADGR